MMLINFKQPKYVLPLIVLPFLCFFFYVWHNNFSKPDQEAKAQDGLNTNIASVSSAVRKKQLTDKLNAYRHVYKEADGQSAVSMIPGEKSVNPEFSLNQSDQHQHTLDSIRAAMNSRLNGTVHQSALPGKGPPLTDAAQAAAYIRRQPPRPATTPPPDPMEVFKQEMAVMDSLTKANDPALKAEKQKKEAAEKLARQQAEQPRLEVSKSNEPDAGFNTVMARREDNLISAAIDENITGFAGSRLRLKLQEDIRAGTFLVRKGTYLYAQITGFSQQRVTLSVTSILYQGQVLPVKLDLYDLDGLPGLYVPESAFRDFTKDLGGSAIQGMTVDGGSGNNQFMMSSLDKMFQSTSSAIAGLIRKNKAKLKYNSFIYLIDPDALQHHQKTY